MKYPETSWKGFFGGEGGGGYLRLWFDASKILKCSIFGVIQASSVGFNGRRATWTVRQTAALLCNTTTARGFDLAVEGHNDALFLMCLIKVFPIPRYDRKMVGCL